MRIIHTDNPAPTDALGQLALYSGMDVLSLYEINDALDEELTPTKRTTYEFEMDLQSALIEMSFNGCHVDIPKQRALVAEFETERTRIADHLHSFCSAAGYYDYYIDIAIAHYAGATDLAREDLPRTWDQWLTLPVQTRRAWKLLDPDALSVFQKALKEFDQPFNANSPAQKLRLFYHFFGHEDNTISQETYPGVLCAYNKTRGINEYKSRGVNGEFKPSTDRDALEKILKQATDDTRDAAFWAQPFIQACLSIADLTKALGFLNCRLEHGIFRSSFGAVTETGRLNSKANAQGYGSNAQNVAPRLRVVLTAPIGQKLGTPDYEQIESRNVGAICYTLFGATAYLNASESGDLHSLACSMVWDDLPWPADFNIHWLEQHGPFPADMIRAAKKIAGAKFYRGKSRRDVSKTLGHGCLTEDHEVLTPGGWVPISTKPPVIMQWPGEFVPVSNWIDKEYEGTFIQWEGQAISVTMTGDHRVYYSTTTEKNITTKPAASVPKSAAILTGSTYVGGRVNEPCARLLAAYHCDGHWGGYNQVRFHLHKQRKVDRLWGLAIAADVEFLTYDDDTKYAINWKPTLHQPSWSMLEWDEESLAAYMDELPYWDGHFGKTSVSLHSSKRDWLDKWQTFNRLLGKGGNIQQPRVSGFGTEMYTLQVNNRRMAARKSFDTDCIFESTAQVYCPTVPSSAFYVRRKGRIHVTGNSNYTGKPVHMAKQSHIDLGLVQHYQQVYFESFPEIPRWHRHVTIQVQTKGEITTLFGRTRQFFGRPSDDATIREAIAFEPQSMAADYTNAAMLDLHKAILRGDIAAELFLQKHDEIGFRYAESDEQTVLPAVQSLMNREITIVNPDGECRAWSVPVEMQCGWNLGKLSAANPDGTTAWFGSDDRVRVGNPFDAMRIVL